MSRNFKVFLLALFGVPACCCIVSPSPPYFVSWPEALLSGWVKRIHDLVTDYDADWFIVAAVVGLFSATVVFVHSLGIWFRGWNRWRWQQSFAISGLVLAFTIAGFAAVNVTHHTSALAVLEDWHVDLNTNRTVKHVNMKHIGFGLIGHQDVKSAMPAGGTFDPHGRGLHGWQTVILPYVDQAPLFQQIDLGQPWTSPQHRAVFATHVPIFSHALAEKQNDAGYALTSYSGNIHLLAVDPMRWDAITDGAANTILLGEVAHNLKPWGMPMNCRDPAIGMQHPDGFGTQDKRRGVLIVMADCTVRWLEKDTDKTVLRALATPRGGEDAKAHELPD